jgi:mitogen-activated protein kinase kinase kinase
LSLEDLRKQLVKFINSEDGTTRTVNVSSCTSGVEVLERALKKFGKWGTGTAVTTDTESDEDGDQLEIDGWGVYEELEYHEDCEFSSRCRKARSKADDQPFHCPKLLC